MTGNLESGLRTSISHAALSAGIAFSFGAMTDGAQAQQTPQPQRPGSNVVLDTVDVEAQQADGDGAYAVQSASSPKQTAPLLDTPQTVTVIPRAIIQERGARNLTEVLRNTPGITFDAGENGFTSGQNNFKLRGFDTSGSIFIDGSRDNGSYTRDTFNTERVEVFKGAAADNGRGGAGGYINMVTKSPILQNFLAGEVGFGFDEYDSKNRKRTTTDINYVVNPTTAIRLNGMWEDGGVAGREVAENNAWGFAPSIAFGLGTHARAIFSYEHVARRDLPDFGVPAHIIRGTKNFNAAVAGVSRDNFYGLRSDFDDANSDVALARFEYDFSKNVTLSNQTRWSRVDRAARFTLPNGDDGLTTGPLPDIPTQTQFYARENTTLTNLTNLSAEFFTGAYKHNASLGLELSREEAKGDRFGTANPGNTSLFDPNPDRSPGAALNPTGWSKVKVDTIAAYVYDTIQLNRQWQITGGVRAEHYKAHIDSNAGNFLDTSETTLGGKVGIVYKPSEDSSIYASVGLSHLPPGSYLSNSDISRGTDEQTFPGFVAGADPVRSLNYEIGVKKDYFGGRLQTTAAIFRTEQRVPVAPGNNLFGYGDQIVQGVEFGIAGEITDRWKVFGGLLFLDSERQLSAAQDLALCQATPGDYGVILANCGTVRADGDEVAFTPNFSANLWMTYRFDNRWTLGGGLQYIGESWVGRPDNANRVVKNGVNGKLPGFLVAHFMASYEIRKDVNIVFNVDNIFDNTYAASLNWSARKAQLGAPRTYRVSGNYRF